ncbi:hypothetical protein EP073_11980 [Geovibrio thiophilus]|uniref:Uncharacterized protein n=1 Tax=Geovibrio thiophilus TaxID=139438 RepID=A0A410K1A2_9BACT|nr:hypothetical protein [Geovibrio thiophilus]QAR34095.1 hypothetical protein EP073_11980 [Geovibrio thiophilus]
MISILVKMFSGAMLGVAKAFLTEKIITMVVIGVLKELAASTKTAIDDRIVNEVAASLGMVDLGEVKKKL